MPCKTMNGACELENRNMHPETSPQAYPREPQDYLFINMGKVKGKNNTEKRMAVYKNRHKQKKMVYEEISMVKFTEEMRDNAVLGKKFQETKAKKTKKEKGEKNAKKNDVLSVTTINDENRSAAYNRINNVPSVNGGLSASPSQTPMASNTTKMDQFDRDLPSAASEQSSHASSCHDFFNNGLLSSDIFPDLAGTGTSLDELLPHDDQSGGLHSLDVGQELEDINSKLNGEFRQHLDNLDCFYPDRAYPGGTLNFARFDHVKLESSPGFLDYNVSGSTGHDATAGPAFSARSAHPPGGPGFNASLGLTQQQHGSHLCMTPPDHIRTVAEAKQRLDEHNILFQQQYQQNHLLMQHQQRHQAMQQCQQKSAGSPFGGGNLGAMSESGHSQPGVMAFSPGSQPGPGDIGPGYGGSGYSQGRSGYDAGLMRQTSQPPSSHPASRMNQNSPGAVGVGVNVTGGIGSGQPQQQQQPGRWMNETLPPAMSFQQQKPFSLAGGDMSYGANGMMPSSGQMTPGGPGKPVFHQGSPNYSQNAMHQRSPAQYNYMNSNSGVPNNGGVPMPRPSSHGHRAMLPNGQSVAINSKMYPTGAGSGMGTARNPYGSSGSHMPQSHQTTTVVYPSNVHNPMDQTPNMRQMTGYRPSYAQQQQPVPPTQQHHHQPPTTFLTSSTALQQQQQPPQPNQAQQPSHFYPQSMPNGFSPSDQMAYGQNHPDTMYSQQQWPGM